MWWLIFKPEAYMTPLLHMNKMAEYIKQIGVVVVVIVL